MVDALVDTSIIIDALRGYHNAIQWINTTPELLGLSRYVLLELIQGAPNKRLLQRTLNFANSFAYVDTSDADVKWAVDTLMVVGLSHNIDAMDSLIAAPAARLQIPLYTRNLKHFTPMLGTSAVAPYT